MEVPRVSDDESASQTVLFVTLQQIQVHTVKRDGRLTGGLT